MRRSPKQENATYLRRRHRLGFNILELTVATAIILVIVAIAAPHLFDARKQANQASAIAAVRTISTAESIYQLTYPNQGYSPQLANLGSNGSTCESPSPTNACLLDPVLSSGFKDGYFFEILGDGKTPDETYRLTATPASSESGECTYSSDQSGDIGVVLPLVPKARSAAAGMKPGCAATF